MNKSSVTLAVLIPILLLSSCATIFPTESIYFDSFPSGAVIYRDGKELGKTPTLLRVKPKNSKHPFVLSKENYDDYSIAPGRKLRPLILIDLVFLFPYSMAIDFLSRSAYQYKNTYQSANLTNKTTQKVEPTAYNAKDHFYIKTKEGKYIFCVAALVLKTGVKYKTYSSNE